jgi:hypothetical protein
VADGLLHTIKVMREEIAAGDKRNREDFAHVGEVLAQLLRDLADIRERLQVRKADKRGRRAVHRSRTVSKP